MTIPQTIAFGCAILCAIVFFIKWRRAITEKSHMLARTRIEENAPAVLSHEIRTPLTLIRGAAELLAEETPGALTPMQREFITTIEENTQLVIDIAENFLADLNLTNKGIKPALIDVRSVVTKAVQELRKFTSANIIVDAPGGVLPIRADPQHLHQLVWNLLNNAANHAGDDATIVVDISNGEAGSLHLTISDDGDGISDEDLAVLFEPFVSGATRRPGSGIGMMIAKRVVELHGGSILVDSQVGRGTEFHVTLPAQPPEESIS